MKLTTRDMNINIRALRVVAVFFLKNVSGMPLVLRLVTSEKK